MALHPNWRSLSTVDLPWKTFVREGETCIPRKEKSAPVLNQNLTGEEAKRLYEEIVKVEPEKSSVENGKCTTTSAETRFKTVQQKDQAGCSRLSTSPLDLDKTTWINKMMKAAQSNDVSTVSSLLKTTEFNINTVDQYGWTVLMCAAGAGSLDVVKLLVERGADTQVKDKSGNSCLSIAKKMKHFRVVNYINSGPIPEEKPILSTNADASTFYCNVCKRSFNDEKEKHLTSTVHLFNSHPGGSRTYYSIPESNRGFQILLKAGWDKEKGLGPEGCGQKFPLKTVLRKDRQGLGQPTKLPARVTHFDAFSPAAVRIERKCLGLLENPQHSLRLLSEIEEIGEEILRDRNEVVALDRRRNQTREALRAVQKSTADKVWMSVGSLLIKIPEKKATEMLKRDQIQVDVEINKMRSELKLKVNKLRDMEHQAPVPGLMLNALTSSEMGALKTAMGVGN